jgi:16S rRNA (cytidine1402-2'-O)-methyltransferase
MNSKKQGILSMVATPIGNLEDMTPRALRTLKEAYAVCCEDPRISGQLLKHLHLEKKKLIAINQRAPEEIIKRVIESIQNGERLAYVSDAGTPNVNDPGGRLAAAAYDTGCAIETIPGPSALTAAIAVCGFPMDHFVYAGFLPIKKHRVATIKRIAEDDGPSIFFESTHRILKTLEELASVILSRRLIYVGRELTKKFETHYRGIAQDVIAELGKGSTKGEFVCIVAPKSFNH